MMINCFRLLIFISTLFNAAFISSAVSGTFDIHNSWNRGVRGLPSWLMSPELVPAVAARTITFLQIFGNINFQLVPFQHQAGDEIAERIVVLISLPA